MSKNGLSLKMAVKRYIMPGWISIVAGWIYLLDRIKNPKVVGSERSFFLFGNGGI
jgi:hypothetical protein